MLHFLRKPKYRWSPVPLKETTKELRNPERGLYKILCFDVSTGKTEKDHLTVHQASWDPDQTLLLAELNLKAYANCPLPEDALSRIDEIFSVLTERGVDLIVRFFYDCEGRGSETEPHSAKQILEHMQQLSPLLHEYGDHIFTTQGLFTGSWGEMHHTRFGSSYYMKQLSDALLSATAPQSFLAVRCPNFWRSIFCTFSPSVDYSDDRRRVGLFNDAITASSTDMGTYGETLRVQALRWEEKFQRDDELQFQSQLCTRVPNGGEVLHPNSYNDLPKALDTFRAMRVTYINAEYDRAVLSKWKKTVYHAPGSVWDQSSGYDYLCAHLGYRYLLRKARPGVTKGQMAFSFVVENTGFAPCYRTVQTTLRIYSHTGEELLALPVNTDPRKWLPGTRTTLTVPVPVERLPRGGSLVALTLHNLYTGKPIHFANTASISEKGIFNFVGELLL